MKVGGYVKFTGSRDNLELDFNMSFADADVVESEMGRVDEIANRGTHAVVTYRTYEPVADRGRRIRYLTVLLPVCTLKEVG